MSERKSKFQKIRENAKEKYGKIHEVYCPYLEENVAFPLNALHHIMYKKGRRKRQVKEQISRYKVLEIVPEVILRSGTVQEYEERVGDQLTKFWGFIAIIGKKKIKVIVRKVGNGKPHFYSVFPKWVTRMLVEA